MKMLLHLRCLTTAVLGLGALLALVRPADAAETTTLDAIRARGYLLCGIGEVQAGFSRVSASGERSGLDAEFCTALASAVFGSKVFEFVLDPADMPLLVFCHFMQ